ncbi:MAG: RluA family pseudouridine synthase [Chloroflexota bacterium]|nr:RluA family pseudouridine synthase [Chloroflexota bacterium]
MPPDERRSHTVPEDGPRLDRYLAETWPDLSRSRLQRLIADGLVCVNDAPTRSSYKVRTGDSLTVRIPPPSPLSIAPEDIPLRVFYEDHDVVVIDKPAGVVVHRAPGHPAGTLVNALLAHCPDLAGIGGVERPGIVHRLDKDTSGLMVVAKNEGAHQNLARQIKERTVTKRYLALVHGEFRPPQGTIDAPIGRDPRNRQRMAVVAGGRAAASTYVTLERLGPYSLLEVQIHTGRTHQIRVHLAHVGHPVVGDPVYGRKGKGAAGQPGGQPLNRQFLHAAVLGFRLPSTGEYREFRCELPADLREVLEGLAAGSHP